MKLSTLEALVLAMRERADYNGVTDPTVEFYERNTEEFRQRVAVGESFLNSTVSPDVCRDTLRAYTVLESGDNAQRGDYAIPLVAC